ncbi:Inner membrane protein YgaZ [Fundidesulfovibrio magnetotacticus]|uniref:Inner membrane protein YgaZ n=1 Tax=Fundidesulfovibrio magnetotacticus TaxID=2730080 RepID=A0A6V8LY78_9BACT|nr:AzlC family ABC transporter permease [Fundidesulfovibrio magnetotacticus]GFK94607.1 Inner membrane protein YgaZ [Fundidesulfovibrio magnetotacticus]
MPQAPTRSEPSAFTQALPIVMGYLPVGFAYGVLAVKAGLGVANAGLMSVLVFAGSAQLIGVEMLGAGAPALSVIATTFVVNLRHVLFSAALSPHLSGWPRARIARFCFQLTDETFALHATRLNNHQQSTAKTLAINAFAQLAWIAGSLAGALAGGLVPDVRPLGLDFALPAMFAVLLTGQLAGRAHALAAVLGAGLCLAISRTPAAPYAVLAGAVAAAGIASLTPWAAPRSGGGRGGDQAPGVPGPGRDQTGAGPEPDRDGAGPASGR